jgi:hypothetical protein
VELAALAVHLMNEYPAEVGSQVLHPVEVLHSDDGAIGALLGVVSHIGITSVVPGKVLIRGPSRSLPAGYE